MSNPFIFPAETFHEYSQETHSCGCTHATAPELEYSSKPAPAYTQCDFIDSRIDVSAQYALYEMVKGGGSGRNTAIQMFSAVKAGRLGGIYQQDQQVPAQRAQALGIGWWQLIPQGQNAVCLSQPKSLSPIIAFRKAIASNRFAVAQALDTVWKTCGISYVPVFPPSGKPCPPKKSAITGVLGGDDPSVWLEDEAPELQWGQGEYQQPGRECIAEAERCLREATQSIAAAFGKCAGNPVCTASKAGKVLLALKRCNEALQRCDRAARSAAGR